MNERNWKKIMLVSLVLMAVLISGFSAMSGNAAAQPVRAKGGVLKIAMQQDLPNFNFWDLTSNTVWKSNVIGWNFESLIGMDYDGSAFPVLAENYTFDTNTLTATLHIRHGVTFQDGVPMTAKDVIFSYCALRQGTTVSGTSFTVPFDDNNDGTVSYDEIKNHVKYIDDYTVSISTKQAYSYFFLGTLGLPIIPEHIWKDHLVDSGDGQGVAVDSHGYTHGIVDVTWNTDPKATIGTGWWMYGGGVRDSYRIEVPYDNYWGKDFKTPDGYPFWNPNVTELYFKVYSNLDTAVLALETGDVDYIAWTIEPGKVPLLQKDPNIQLHFLSDRGYFYLAFNEKTKPANYLAFRHAVSHVIDKKSAVERYLGGFGQAGDAAEPPFFDAWYNSSVQHYPYDINAAKTILDGNQYTASNGYREDVPGEKFTDVNGDGWRDLPDGSPIQPITLFTPPADYDPVRIKVGQGIAQNLRSIGINIQAKPVDFDTLVAYMQSYNYQMLELGWLLSTDPIGNLADIYGPKSIQNTYGWWNTSDPNPYYVNAGGVINTLADQPSQAYATLFDKVINKAMTTFDVNKQIKYTKWAQDILAKAVVCNVLYYRLNVEATRNSWQGWVEWQGSVYNGLSLGLLHSGVSHVAHVTAKYLDMGVNVPNKVLVGNTVTGEVYVANSQGLPVSGATVQFEAANGLSTITTKTNYTDENGMLEFSLTANNPGFEILNITASYGDYQSITKSVVLQYVNAVPHLLTMNVKANKYSLNPGDEDKITVTVVDENGAPVKGALVSVDTELVGYGSVTPKNTTTDANGIATFTYTAPSASDMSGKYIDMHTIAKFVFDVKKEGYDLTNTVTFQLITYNSNPSHWDIVRVEKVTNYTVNSTSLKTEVHLFAEDVDGSPLGNKDIAITYSNASYLSGAPDKVTTNSKGWANFTLTFNNNLPTKVVRINFKISSAHSVGDSIDILYWNGAVGVPLYGGHISVSPFMDNGGYLSYTVELYNETNKHPVGQQQIGTVLTATPDGQLVDMDWPFFATTWEYVGINIYGDYSDSVIGTAGEWNGQADKTNATVSWLDWGVDLSDYGLPSEWNVETTWDYINLFYGYEMDPFVITNGTGTFGVYGDISTYRDLPVTLYVVTGGLTYYITDPSVNNFVMYGNQTLSTEFAVQRAMDIIITSYNIDQPYAYAGDQMPITVHAMNQTNVMQDDINEFIYNNAKSYKAAYPANNSTTGGGDMALIPTDSTTKEYSTVLDYTPVVKSSVVVVWYYMNAEYYAKDDGSGHIVNTTGSPLVTGTIDYNTGAISLNFSMAPDMGFVIVSYNYAGEATVMIDTPKTSSPSEYDAFIMPDASSSSYFGEYNVLEATQFPVVPHQLFITVEPTAYMVDLGGTVGFTAVVTDEDGNIFSGATVSATSTDGSIINAGQNEFILDTSGMTASSVLNPVEVTLSINGIDGYLVGATTVTVLVRNLPPTLTINSISNGAVIYQDSLPLTGFAYDSQGISSVVITVDGGTPQSASLAQVSGGVQWGTVLTGLSEGNHTVVITAEDSQGVTQTQQVTFTVKFLQGSKNIPDLITNMTSNMDTNMWLGLIGIILAIIAIILAVVLKRKPSAPAPAEEEVPEEAPPEEEATEEAPSEEETEVAEEETPPEEGGEET